MSTVKPEPIVERFARVAPFRDSLFAESCYVDAVEELARAISASDRQPQSRWLLFRGRAAVIAIAVLLLVPISIATADQLSAHTGIFGAPGQTENDTSEWLRANAPDFGTAIAPLVPNLPLPAGASWRDAIVEQGRANPGVVQVTSVRWAFEAYARCAWVRSWTDAFARGDPAAMRHGAAVLAASAKWPATVATDGGD